MNGAPAGNGTMRWTGCNRPRASVLRDAIELNHGPVWRRYAIRGRYYRMRQIEASPTHEVWQVWKKER